MKIIDFKTPRTVQETCAEIRKAAGRAYVVAGGTSLNFIRVSKDEKVAVDIHKLPLKFITCDGKAFRIGALATIDDMQKYASEGWVLDRVAVKLATQQIRNISTIGGNISKLFYWSDFPVALLALDAIIIVSGESEKRIEAETFFQKQPAQYLGEESSIVTSVEIAVKGGGRGFGFVKEARTATAFSSCTAAASVKVENGIISEARVAIGSCVVFPQRLREIEKQLIGRKADSDIMRNVMLDEINGLLLIPKDGMTEMYCRNLAMVKVADAVTEAVNEAAGRVIL